MNFSLVGFVVQSYWNCLHLCCLFDAVAVRKMMCVYYVLGLCCCFEEDGDLLASELVLCYCCEDVD